jgi:hypothetical protein
VRDLQLDPDVEAAVLGGNFMRLQAHVGLRQAGGEQSCFPVPTRIDAVDGKKT